MVRLKTVMSCVATAMALATLWPLPPLELPPVAAVRLPSPHHEPVRPFVLPVVSIHPSGVDYGVATAFVIDRERGYLATAAHTGVGTKFLVRLPEGVWLPALRIRTSRAADVSVLAVPDGMGMLLPDAPPLTVVPKPPYMLAAGEGWRMTRYLGQRAVELRPVVRLLGMLRNEATICAVSAESCEELIALIQRALLERRGLVGSERHLAYSKFILLMEMDDSDGSIKYGLSGGPVLDFAGRPFAVIAMSNGTSMLAVPITEVTKLIR